jgi:hypothetical protein
MDKLSVTPLLTRGLLQFACVVVLVSLTTTNHTKKSAKHTKTERPTSEYQTLTV